jgi:hypothetical protein
LQILLEKHENENHHGYGCVVFPGHPVDKDARVEDYHAYEPELEDCLDKETLARLGLVEGADKPVEAVRHNKRKQEAEG